MPQLMINGILVNAPENATLLEAAAQLGIAIPTLCHAAGRRPNTSCMVCVVEDTARGRLLPACAAKVEEGIAIETDSETVHNARRAVLELLMSEHQGDCEAPCERSCPAGLNIPLMLRYLMRDDLDAAQALARRALVLPATLGQVCTAPCEAGCRRGTLDESIAIRRIHGALGEMHGEEEVAAPDSGKTVVVIGSGPAGLAAACILRAYGHACRVYEKKAVAGGSLRDFPEEQLPAALLDAEIHRLEDKGIKFVFDTEIGTTISLKKMIEESDAVIVACKIEVPEQESVFHAAEKKMPVRSIASGKEAAQTAQHFLTGNAGSPAEYNSTMGRIPREQLDVYIIGRQNQGQSRIAPVGRLLGTVPDFTGEAARCLHCDCHAPVSCKLRQYATQYGVRPKTFRNAERPLPNGLQRYGNVIFDAGKCIKCGLCVAITKENQEALGMTFTQRGFSMQVSIPFNESLEKALAQSASECVTACPTGALAFEASEERA